LQSSSTGSFPAFDLNLAPKWQANFRVGAGVTDPLVAKMILGYRFDF